jgi:protein-disulfide isomerase
MRRLIAGLIMLLAAAPVSAEGLTDLTDTERTLLQAEIRQYLLENPEIILEVIDLLEERRANQQATDDIALIQDNSERLFDDGFSYVGGNPEGTLTIVEFTDYQCGYCKRAHPDIKMLLEQQADVRFVVKEFPILGPASEVAARAALSVLKDEGEEVYHAFNDALMSFEGRLNDNVLDQVAEANGIDVGKMRETMESEEIKAQVAATLDLARAIRATGTPTFVIGEKILRGYLPLEDMTSIVEGELAKM